MYSNTIKHLLTLNGSIRFPLEFVTNHNRLSKKRIGENEKEEGKKDGKKDGSLVLELRKYINQLIIDKRDYEIKSKLKFAKD